MLLSENRPATASTIDSSRPYRIIALAFLLTLVAPGLARAQESLDEERFVSLVRQQLPQLQVIDSEIELQHHQIHEARLRAPVGVSVEREEVFSGGEGLVQKNALVLDWRVELSGARSLRVKSAQDRARASELEGEWRKELLLLDALSLFYRGLHDQQRVATLEESRGPLADLVARLQRQVDLGQASGLDLRRFQLELADHDDALLAARGQRDATLARIGTLAGLAPQAGLSLRGTLQLAQPSAPSGGERADIRAARHREASARRLRKAASRWWIPAAEISVGYMATDLGPGTGPGADLAHGYVGGLRLELPLPSHGAAKKHHTEATLRKATAELATAAEAQRREEVSSRILLDNCLEREQLFVAQQMTPTQELLERSKTAYAGGEANAMELSDAFRRVSRSKLRHLALRLECKEAELSLRRTLPLTPQSQDQQAQ